MQWGFKLRKRLNSEHLEVQYSDHPYSIQIIHYSDTRFLLLGKKIVDKLSGIQITIRITDYLVRYSDHHT